LAKASRRARVHPFAPEPHASASATVWSMSKVDGLRVVTRRGGCRRGRGRSDRRGPTPADDRGVGLTFPDAYRCRLPPENCGNHAPSPSGREGSG